MINIFKRKYSTKLLLNTFFKVYSSTKKVVKYFFNNLNNYYLNTFEGNEIIIQLYYNLDQTLYT